MSAAEMTGNAIVCAVLEQLGVQHTFGLPGTQNVPLFEALRQSHIRTVVPTHELAASFMAGAYYRASGRVGVLVTIPGPGFAYALAGLAEARLDSAAVVHLVGAPASGPGRAFNLQAFDQRGMVLPLVKGVIDVPSADRVADAVLKAFTLAEDGEPGPVVVQLAAEALNGTASFSRGEPTTRSAPVPDPDAVSRVAKRLRDAGRVVLYVGQGARGAAVEVRQLAERIAAPVATTPSGRGTLPEDHPLALGFDGIRAGPGPLNALMADADAVLVLGAKLGHNGTAGFAVAFPRDRTVQVDSDRAVLGANYDVAELVQASIAPFLNSLMAHDLGPAVPRGWAVDAISECRNQLRGHNGRATDPRIQGTDDGTPAALFAKLQSQLPRDAILVTDTGRHQQLARRFYDVLAPRGLLLPSDLQSMGFGLSAAIAAKLAAPERPVVAVIGDGGFLMSGLELATAVREQIAITVVVFSDGAYGQIRDHQLMEYGRSHGVAIGSVPIEGVARALGCDFVRFSSMGSEPWVRSSGVLVVEVDLSDSRGMRAAQATAVMRGAARRVVGESLLRRLKRLLGT
ncbi:MAG: thiamine pyrophosphate-binding protein [Gemmatimonadaceae bacterium]